MRQVTSVISFLYDGHD